MSATYQIERVVPLLEEIKPLLQSHYEEIARHKDKIALNPDYDRYRELDNLGCIHVVTARKGGELIGYNVSFVMPHIHYKDHLMSVNDILYVSPNHRRGMVALKMLKFVEESLRDIGVTKIHMNMKSAHDFGTMLERMGYTEIERIYERMLI